MKTSAFQIVLIVLFFISGCVFAQSPDTLWTRTLSGQVGYSVFPTPDGGFVVGGYKHVSGYRDFYICKTDDQGELLWEHTYGIDDLSETMNAMIQTSDGGFLMVGNRPEPAPYSSYSDVYMVKTDADGIQEWFSLCGVSGESESPADVAETLEGGFIMCGSNWYSGTGYDVVLIKVNELGALEWKEHFNLDGSSAEHGVWVETAPTGSFLIAGETQAFTTNYDYDAFVMMTTPSGTLESITTFGEPWPMYEGANRLLQTSDGHWLIAGYQNNDGIDNNWYVVKTGTSGWTHVIGGTYHDKAFNACETSDGGYAVTGTYYENGNWNSCIVRYTTDGDTLWTKKWGDPDHSKYNYDIKELDDGGFITVGSVAATGQNPNVYLTRLIPGTVGAEEHISELRKELEILSVRPNPSRGSTRITYTLDRKSTVKAAVYDLNGYEIAQVLDEAKQTGTHELIIDHNLAPGIYFCRMRSEHSSGVVRLVKMQ